MSSLTNPPGSDLPPTSSADDNTPSPSPSPSPEPSNESSADEPSTPAATTRTVRATSAEEDVVTTVQVSSLPPTTQLITSVVTTAPADATDEQEPVTVIVTSVSSFTPAPEPSGSEIPSLSSSASTAAPLQSETEGSDAGGGGLSEQGEIAVAVVVPVVVVALLLLGGLFFWRRRKQRKSAEEARRKEVEEYGFNPNNDPTLPPVAAVTTSEMTEDQSGYRGWGNSANHSNRKGSTTLTGGLTGGTSDNGSTPGGYGAPASPTKNNSDSHSTDPLMRSHPDGGIDGEPVAALGGAPIAGSARPDIRRGPSNASSSYSAGHQSDHSADAPIPLASGGGLNDYYDGPSTSYPPHTSIDGGYGAAGLQQPIVRDVAARRNTRIENPKIYPQQGNSGIAQNF